MAYAAIQKSGLGVSVWGRRATVAPCPHQNQQAEALATNTTGTRRSVRQEILKKARHGHLVFIIGAHL